jgi:hypothetical protein
MILSALSIMADIAGLHNNWTFDETELKKK